MIRYVLKHTILLLCLFYFIYERTILASEWKTHFQTTLMQTDFYQQFLLYENDLNNTVIHEIENKFSKIIPTRVVDFQNMISGDQKNLRLDPYLLQVTRVVIIPSDSTRNISKIIKVLDIVAKMSQQRSRPKVLITVTNGIKISKYKKFFQLCWTKQFLDISVLKLEQRKENEWKLTDNFDEINAHLIYYNPFTKKLTRTNLRQQTDLFPDKLHNLNGYKMNVSLFDYRPYVNIERNLSGHVLNLHGPDINLWKTMTAVMNFSINFHIFNLTTWPKVNCTKEYNTGMLRKAIYNENQLFGVQSTLFKSCVNDLLATGKGTRVINMVILVPIFPNENKELQTEWNLINVVLIFFLFPIPWILGRYLDLNPQNWKLMYTVQISLGLTVPQMPVKTIERLLMLTMMFFFLFQSSYIFSTLSNFQLQKETVYEIRTYRELYEKNLTLITHSTGYRFNTNDTAFEKMFNSAIFSENSLDDCAQMGNDYQNVSCFARELPVILAMDRIRKSGRGLRMKIFPRLQPVPGGVIFYAPGSPFLSRFDNVINLLIESGISDKWDAANSPIISRKPSKIDLFKEEISLTSKVFKLMMFFFLFGYLCSMLAFGLEIFIHKFL